MNRFRVLAASARPLVRSMTAAPARSASFVAVTKSQSRAALPRIQIRAFSVVTEKLDSLGDSISTAVLLNWQKKAGDAVREDDVIAVVETDKVTMEIRSKRSGVFVEGLAAAGAEVTVGHDLWKIDTAVTAAAGPAAPAAAPAASSGAVIDAAVPSMGESISQGILSKWLAKEVESVALDQVVAI